MKNTKSESSSSSDESLDLTSKKFNPLKALYSKKVKVPVPDAPTFDNLAKYDSTSRRFRGEIPVSNAVSIFVGKTKSDRIYA